MAGRNEFQRISGGVLKEADFWGGVLTCTMFVKEYSWDQHLRKGG